MTMSEALAEGFDADAFRDELLTIVYEGVGLSGNQTPPPAAPPSATAEQSKTDSEIVVDLLIRDHGYDREAALSAALRGAAFDPALAGEIQRERETLAARTTEAEAEAFARSEVGRKLAVVKIRQAENQLRELGEDGKALLMHEQGISRAQADMLSDEEAARMSGLLPAASGIDMADANTVKGMTGDELLDLSRGDRQFFAFGQHRDALNPHRGNK